MSTESPAPEYDGECAFALSTGKKNVEGMAKHALVDGDRTYYFSNPVARLLWKILPNRQAKADATWAAG
ncbi:MAG: hypothetical protein ACR2P0_17585 [Acidimicrobiales bacterium]